MFPLEQTRPEIAKFLARERVFQEILPVHGSIVECGVREGAGLMTWALLSSIFEPVNHTREVIGFDTFDGFPSIHENDAGAESTYAHVGGMAAPGSYERIMGTIQRFDMDRPVGRIPKVRLVKGDACETIPRYAEENPHLVVALLHLDFDIYEPTKAALDSFLPLMPQGGVIVFDELNVRDWPGETVAVRERLGLAGLTLRRFPFTSTLSYAVIG